jgi:hypothetical protein
VTAQYCSVTLWRLHGSLVYQLSLRSGFHNMIHCCITQQPTVYQVCLRGNSFHIPSPNNGLTYHTAPFLRLFVPNSLTVHHRRFLPRLYLQRLFLWLGVSFLPVVRFPTATFTPSLRPARPERLTTRVLEDLDVPPRFKVLTLPPPSPLGTNNSWSGRCSPISGSSYANIASISASEGLPLHNVHFLIFYSPRPFL